jgi:putative transposase
MGLAIPFKIGRHAHPKAKPEQPQQESPPASGIGYLRLIDAAHQAELAERVNYSALAGHPTPPQQPAQPEEQEASQ